MSSEAFAPPPIPPPGALQYPLNCGDGPSPMWHGGSRESGGVREPRWKPRGHGGPPGTEGAVWEKTGVWRMQEQEEEEEEEAQAAYM